MFAMLSERVSTAELSNFAEGASKSPRHKQSRLSHEFDFWFAFLWRDASIGRRFMMLLKKSPPQLRLIFLRAVSKTTRAFSYCYTPRIVFEGQMANDATACDIEDFHTRLRGSATSRS